MMPSFFKSEHYVKDPISKIKYPISSSSSSSRSSSSPSRGSSRSSHSPTIMYQTGHIINHNGNPNLFASEQDHAIHQTSHHEYNVIYPSPAYARSEPAYTRTLTPPTSRPLPLICNYGPLPLPPTQSTAYSIHLPSSPTLPGHYGYEPTVPDHHGRTFTDIDYVKKLHATLSSSEPGISTSASGPPFLPPTGSKTAPADPGDDDKKIQALRDDFSKLKSKLEDREQAELHAKIRAEAIKEGKKEILSRRRYPDFSSSEYDTSDSDSYGSSHSNTCSRGQNMIPTHIVSLPSPPCNRSSHYSPHGNGGFIAAGGGPSGGVSIYPSPGPRSRSYTRVREIHNDDKNNDMVSLFDGTRERDHRRMIMEKADLLRLEDEIRNRGRDGRGGDMVGVYRY